MNKSNFVDRIYLLKKDSFVSTIIAVGITTNIYDNADLCYTGL